MSRLCAKPSCVAPVERWFDFAAADCHVVERGSPTPSTVGLCATHADRFTLPQGWTLDIREPASSGAESVPRNRSHDRETPWFLTLSDTPAPDVGIDGPALRNDDPVFEPSAGSLLHRAFHGPDRETDVRRAHEAERDREPVSSLDAAAPKSADELTPRRVARKRTTDCDTIELPFPPRESAQHSAVS
ncbi:MAG: hypothetical protein ACI81L_002362 [Verrucomicrobiales bacterium]|jgi:hypothetical protein